MFKWLFYISIRILINKYEIKQQQQRCTSIADVDNELCYQKVIVSDSDLSVDWPQILDDFAW